VKWEEHDILTQVIKWMDHSYGQTLMEQIDEVGSQLRRLQRDKNDDIISYIEKFDKLSRAQMENLNTIVDLGSTQMDLEEQMKQTTRRTTINPNNEVYAMNPGGYKVHENHDNAQQPQQNDVLYKEHRRQQHSGQQGGNQPRKQTQLEGYRSHQEQPRSYQEQGYQDKPRDPLETCYNVLNNLMQEQQLEIISKLEQAYRPATAGPTNHLPEAVFQEDDEETSAETVMFTTEQVYFTNQLEATSTIVDKDPTQNLIGQQLLPVLARRLQDKVTNMKLEHRQNHFGRHNNTICKTKCTKENKNEFKHKPAPNNKFDEDQ